MAAETKTEYLVITSNIKSDENGCVDISTRIDGGKVSEEDLLKIKALQTEYAQAVEALLK